MNKRVDRLNDISEQLVQNHSQLKQLKNKLEHLRENIKHVVSKFGI